LASFFSSINLSRMASIWELANPQLRDITVYELGKPIEETARELGVEPEAIIKLASNENPLGPSPKAIQAMRAALGNAHLYPDGSGFYLRKTIAVKLGLAAEDVILGNGSNEVIEFLGHAFLDATRQDEVIASAYAFVVYKLIATSFGARMIEVPSPDYKQDLEAMLEAVTPKTRLIFIPNPNNPTGTLISQRAIDSFMSRVPEKIMVVFDEHISNSSMIRRIRFDSFGKAETSLFCEPFRRFMASRGCASGMPLRGRM
jgi:histidinol-phosphate aminotransferase